jgi:ATP-binding cassette subfamily E protein 1
MNLQSKKTFAMVDYQRCNPDQCDPEKGLCAAVPACTHKVLKQIDGAFESPMVFQDMCMGCWDCIEACPLDAIEMKHIT